MAQSASERQSWEQTWSNARTWEDLLDLNRRYLLGDLNISANCAHPVDDETQEIVSGLLRLADFGLLTTSSQPEVRAGEPRYFSPEYLRSISRWANEPLPKVDQQAYLRAQLHRIRTEFSQEQLENNDTAVLLSVRSREREHRDSLNLYAANEILDSGNPGTWNVVSLYEKHIGIAVGDLARYNEEMSLRWKQHRQRQYVNFLVPTIHPNIPLKAVIRSIESLMEHENLVVAFQYEMNGESPQRQPPAHRTQDPTALELFGKFTTTIPLLRRGTDKPFWWPVTETREATSPVALLNTVWRGETQLGNDCDEHIQGMLFGHFNDEAYPAGVEADPVAVLVGLVDWESDVDLLALLVQILQEEGFEDLSFLMASLKESMGGLQLE